MAASLALAGCETEGTEFSARALKPLSPAMIAELERKSMPKESPILVRLFKEEAELEVWKQDTGGRFALLATYPICRWSGELGPKTREGDRQAPEGFYTITPAQMNPNSHYYLSFDIGYPNAFDRSYGRTGADLMIHGDCSSRGCYAMTDDFIGEIYALARESFFGGQRSFQVQAYPFRMTPVNLARHRNNPNMPFWKMLKEGNDHFELTRLEPTVNVCEKRYVFDAEPPANASPARPPGATLSFNPTGRCPAYTVPHELAAALAEKSHQDEIQTAELVSRGTPTAPVVRGTDGGTHPALLSMYHPQTIREANGTVHTVVEKRAAPFSFWPDILPRHEPETAAAVEPVTGTVAARSAAQPAASAAPSQNRPTASKGTAPTEAKQTAATEPAAAGEDKKQSGSLFTRLFRPAGGEEKKPEPQAAAAGTGSSSGPKQAPALRPTLPATAVAARTPQKPQPHPDPSPQAQPPQAQAQPPQPPAQQPKLQAWPQPPPPNQTAAASNNGTNLLSGTTVVPAGTFDSRWSGVR